MSGGADYGSGPSPRQTGETRPLAPTQRFTPRYLEIAQTLRTRIAGLRPHDPLPSDADLCQEFGVSRMTARAAVQCLVQAGLVYRQAGRGSFVAAPTIDRQLSNLRGFSAEMAARGMTATSVVLRAAFQPGDDAQTAALRLPRATLIVVIERVRLADGTPMCLERASLTARCAGVLDADLQTGSLHAAVVQQGVLPNSGHSSVTAELADATDAVNLGVRSGAPLLVERRLIADAAETPIEWTQSRYVPARFSLTARFRVELPRGVEPR